MVVQVSVFCKAATAVVFLCLLSINFGSFADESVGNDDLGLPLWNVIGLHVPNEVEAAPLEKLRGLPDLAVAFAHLAAALKDPHEQLGLAHQHVEHIGQSLKQAIETTINNRRLRYSSSSSSQRLRNAVQHMMSDVVSRLNNADKLLDSLSYKSVLERGYVVVRDSAGDPITRTTAAIPGSDVIIRFIDGEVSATIHADEIGFTGKSAKSNKKRKPSPDDSQGSLL